MTHPGLHKLFRNLSIATKHVEERKHSREKLHGYLDKIRIVASRSPKKSVIHSEVVQLEKHISDMLQKKQSVTKKKPSESEIKRLHEKEEELDNKIQQLNLLLIQVGKKVDEKKLKSQLGKKNEVEVLEDKLYTLESKYQEIKDDSNIPSVLLQSIQDKISLLKEKIREYKNK